MSATHFTVIVHAKRGQEEAAGKLIGVFFGVLVRKYYLTVRPEYFDSAGKVLNLTLGKTQSD